MKIYEKMKQNPAHTLLVGMVVAMVSGSIYAEIYPPDVSFGEAYAMVLFLGMSIAILFGYIVVYVIGKQQKSII